MGIRRVVTGHDDDGKAVFAGDTVIEPDTLALVPGAENPGMHTTATIDYEFVVSGRVVLELDDGATCELGPGDTVIQNGTRHAWRNPYDEPCVLTDVLIAADHSGIPQAG